MSKNKARLVVGFAFYLTTALCIHADQVNMQNGDRFVGKVVTVSNETVVVQSDVLGTLLVPRNKIVTIVLGTNAVAPVQAVAAPVPAPAIAVAQPARPAATPMSANPSLSAAIQQLRTDTNAVRQVQKQVQQQILAGADPQATEMFNQMVGGLMNGSLNVDDIRAQAKTAADQLRAAKKELGDEAGFAVDGYLAVLDGFLRETATTSTGTATNAPALPSKPKRGQLFEDE